MKPGQDLSDMPGIQRFRFRHRARVSVRIWKSFDEGRVLFPTDAAAELTVQVEALHHSPRIKLNMRGSDWKVGTDKFAVLKFDQQ